MNVPWYVWAGFATLFWGVWGALSGVASRTGTAMGVLAGAVVVEAIVVAPFWPQIKESSSWALVGTGVTGVVAYGCLFMALRSPGAQTGPAIAITALYPIITALLAWLTLGEDLSHRQIAGIVLAVIAAALIVSD